jgi:hypothetical protein
MEYHIGYMADSRRPTSTESEDPIGDAFIDAWDKFHSETKGKCVFVRDYMKDPKLFGERRYLYPIIRVIRTDKGCTFMEERVRECGLKVLSVK